MGGSPRTGRRRSWIVAFSALIVVRVVVVGAVLHAGANYRPGTAYSNDVTRYREIATATGLPYRDFAVEFPPVSLAFIEAISSSRDHMMENIAWASVLLDLLVAGALAYGWGRRTSIAYLVLGSIFLLYPFVYFRLDLLSVALAVWGVALVKRGHDVSGGVSLALAVLAKLWPLALVPFLVVERRPRAMLAFVATGSAVVGAWLAVAGTRGVEQVLSFRHARGWHIESVGGELVRLSAGGPIANSSGALRIGDVSLGVTAALGALLIGVVGWVWWRAAHVQDPGGGLVSGVAPITAIAAFLVCSPLLSPQYVLWILPFAAVCVVAGHRWFGALTALSAVLTMLIAQQYSQLETGAVAFHVLLMIRNGSLVGVVVLGITTLARAHLGERSDQANVERELQVCDVVITASR